MSKSLNSVFIAVTFVFLGLSPAYADTILVDLDLYSTDSRNSGDGGGIDATGWGDGGFQLSWNITHNEEEGTYSYQYTITGLDGGDLTNEVAYWISELTPNVDWTGVFDDLSYPVEVGNFSPEQGNSNPGLPGELFGIKFEDGTLEVSFVTPYAPEWGDFYARGGAYGEGTGRDREYAYAYNTGFGDMPDENTTDFTNWIAIDGWHPVPEPSTLILLLSSMGFLAGAAGFRKKI
jgi:hypothetical protein